MKHRQVSIAFMLYLLLMGCAVQASSQAQVQTKPSVEFTVLQLNQPRHSLNRVNNRVRQNLNKVLQGDR